MAIQPPADENKALKDHKIALKRKVPSSKKTYIHNYFIRARSGVGEGEGEPTTLMDDPIPLVLASLPTPILEPDPVPKPTRIEEKREQGQEQKQDSTGCMTSFGMESSIIGELLELADTALEERWNFGMDSSIIGELLELADTALEERWNSPNVKSRFCQRVIGSNMCLVSTEHELEAERSAGPVPTIARVKLEKRKLKPPSDSNLETMAEIHQQAQSQIEETQVNEFIDNKRSCSTPLQC
ncbi:hypothetical protein NDU88_006810 [Pleurodeles waltl]|uniref:Uncharacterized protein n=1 Tax=Pleurodeles waltl TaxID=8319 RepID=A0AAV7X2N0_PLEWA|nr:hypothetical protein NDU88_006810 [Pleurodeles waltl]